MFRFLLWFSFVHSAGDLRGRVRSFVGFLCGFCSVFVDFNQFWGGKNVHEEANLQSKGARLVAIFALKVGDNKLDPAVLRAAQIYLCFVTASNKLLHPLLVNGNPIRSLFSRCWSLISWGWC